IPVPPTTVNQNVEIIGAIIATDVTNCRIVRPRDILVTNIAIIGPYPKNHAKKNIVQLLNQPSSPRYAFNVKKFSTYVAIASKYEFDINNAGPSINNTTIKNSAK